MDGTCAKLPAYPALSGGRRINWPIRHRPYDRNGSVCIDQSMVCQNLATSESIVSGGLCGSCWSTDRAVFLIEKKSADVSPRSLPEADRSVESHGRDGPLCAKLGVFAILLQESGQGAEALSSCCCCSSIPASIAAGKECAQLGSCPIRRSNNWPHNLGFAEACSPQPRLIASFPDVSASCGRSATLLRFVVAQHLVRGQSHRIPSTSAGAKSLGSLKS